MPISDGYEACQKIRKLFEEKKLLNINKQMVPPYILASSSFINKDTIRKTNNAGFDQAVECPIPIESIRNNILPRI